MKENPENCGSSQNGELTVDNLDGWETGGRAPPQHKPELKVYFFTFLFYNLFFPTYLFFNLIFRFL